MNDSDSSQRSCSEPRDRVVPEVRPFDPGPSIAAAAEALGHARAAFALIDGLALDAWGIPRATKGADLAVPVGTAEAAAEALRGPDTDVRPLRVGGVGLRDNVRDLRIQFIDRRFHFAPLFQQAIDEAQSSGRQARVGGTTIPLVSLEYLLAMKVVSGEPKDEIDARRILRREDLRDAAARTIVETHLGVASANRLDALAREAGRPEVARPHLYRNGEEPE